MKSFDIIPFLPEVFLLISALVAIVVSAFWKDRFTPAIILFFQSMVVAGLVFLWGFNNPHDIYAFSDFLVFNPFTRYLKIIILVSLVLVQAAIVPHVEKESLYKPEFFAFMAFSTVGYLLMVSSVNFISLFMATELASFSTYLLVAFNRNSLTSTEAALKYFVLGALGTALFLFGVSFIYGALGTVSFNAVLMSLSDTHNNSYMLIGLLFIIVAFCFKLSVVPFHMWTPDVYQGSATPVTLFLSVIPKIAAAGVFITVMIGLFYKYNETWQPILTVLSVLSMAMGAFTALFQKNIKRIIAYSTISHMGYILMGMLSADFQGVSSILVYIVIYSITVTGIFACLLCLKRQDKNIDVSDDLKGLGSDSPFIAGALLIFLFSLTGMPPLAGFFAKLTLFSAALKNGHLSLVIIGVLTSVVAAGFYLKIIKIMYFDAKITLENGYSNQIDIQISKSTAVVIVTAAVFIIGYIFMPNTLSDMAHTATKSLFSKARF